MATLAKTHLKLKVLQLKEQKALSPLPGLYYYPNFLKPEQAKEILAELEASSKWVGVSSSSKSRRVIHYGYLYSYTGGPLQKTDSIPPSLQLFEKGKDIPELLKDWVPDQLIINEY